jgi:hypothetical protein
VRARLERALAAHELVRRTLSPDVRPLGGRTAEQHEQCARDAERAALALKATPVEAPAVTSYRVPPEQARGDIALRTRPSDRAVA